MPIIEKTTKVRLTAGDVEKAILEYVKDMPDLLNQKLNVEFNFDEEYMDGDWRAEYGTTTVLKSAVVTGTRRTNG